VRAELVESALNGVLQSVVLLVVVWLCMRAFARVSASARVFVWSLVAAGQIGAAGRVTAFEPNPSAYRRLIQNVAASGPVGRRITAMNVAVGTASATLTSARRALAAALSEPDAEEQSDG